MKKPIVVQKFFAVSFVFFFGKKMGGGHSHSVEHHYVAGPTVYVPDPATQQQLVVLQNKLEKVEKEAQVAGDPNLYVANANKILDNLIEKIPEMKLTQSIEIKTGEVHVGVVGNISVGKSTLLNAMFGLKLPVSMDHCTEGCKVVHRKELHYFWDVAGKNDDFRFYNPENLSFVKSLGIVVVLYSEDIELSANLIRVVAAINPCNVVLVRTKVDQYRQQDARSLEEIRERDTKIAKRWIADPRIFFVSAHNILDGKTDKYDWDALVQKLTV